MSSPSSFILSSDYGTLKNDTDNVVTITIPASATIPGNSYVAYTSDVTASQAGSIVQTQIGDSYLGQVVCASQVIFHHETADPYDVFCLVFRPSPTTLRCVAYIPNPYAGDITGLNQAVTYTFYVDTFLPPVV